MKQKEYMWPILTNMLRIHDWPQNFGIKVLLLLLISFRISIPWFCLESRIYLFTWLITNQNSYPTSSKTQILILHNFAWATDSQSFCLLWCLIQSSDFKFHRNYPHLISSISNSTKFYHNPNLSKQQLSLVHKIIKSGQARYCRWI